jgi:hypothetical protein
MASISILGESFTPEFIGALDDASVAENVAPSPRTSGIQKRDPAKPAEVGWTFSCDGGPRGIYVQYSSAQELPCELLVNGKVVQSHALFETTHGLKLVDWRYQCSVDLKRGKNKVSIRSAGHLPHIRMLAVGPVPSQSQASVDDYFDHLSAERAAETLKRPFKLRPAEMAGVIQAARRLASDDAAVRKLASVASLAVTASQEHVMNGQAAIPWGGPLNGQRFRQHVMERLMRIGADAIFETGTFLGTSTAFFARHGLPVHSCELRDEYFASALSQLTAFDNVTLYLMDSRAFLREMAGDPALDYKRPFFYLDAHWYDDLPLSDEIRIIQDRWDEYFIMVDDFCVPEAAYNFDRYPNGLELTLEHLDKEGVDLSETAVLFPSASATAETSARRGTLVLTPLRLYEEHLRGERAMFRYLPKR